MTMEDERIDFSTLDPSRDELRWRRTVEALATRALDERRRRFAVQQQLLRWARPVLVAAAGLCIVAWAATFIGASAHEGSAASPVSLTLANWAANHQMPEPNDLLTTLRGTP
jgi:hypothetical protein